MQRTTAFGKHVLGNFKEVIDFKLVSFFQVSKLEKEEKLMRDVDVAIEAFETDDILKKIECLQYQNNFLRDELTRVRKHNFSLETSNSVYEDLLSETIKNTKAKNDEGDT